MRHATFRQLKVFESAARHLNFSRAAEELFLTQPGVSATIRQLEALAGFRLFEQIGKRLHLTTGGALLLAEARGILERVAMAEDAVAQFKGDGGGLLRLVTISAGNFFVPRLASLFRQQHGGTQIHLHVQQQNEVLRLLQDNEADFAIMGRPPAQPEFIGSPFAPHPYGFIVHPAHPLARARDLTLDALRGESVIVRRRGSDNRRIWDELMERRSLPLAVGSEASSNEMLKEMAAAGLGIGWVSLHAVSGDLAQGQLASLDVSGFPLMRRWYLVRHRDKSPSVLGKAFSDFLLHQGAEYVNALIREPGLRRKVQLAVQARESAQGGAARPAPRPRRRSPR